MNKLLLLCFLILSIFAVFIEVDNSLDVWIEDNKEGSTWKNFQEYFGSDDFVILAVQNQEKELSEAFVITLNELEEQLQKIKYVQNVVSIVSIFNNSMDFDDDGRGDDVDDLKILCEKNLSQLTNRKRWLFWYLYLFCSTFERRTKRFCYAFKFDCKYVF